MYFVCFVCFSDRFFDFRVVPLSFGKVTSQYKKEEYTSSLVTNFQISSWFIFRDIHVCILSIRCFLCVLHVLLTVSSIFSRFHSASRRITSQEKKDEYISVQWPIFKSSASLFSEIYTFVSCQYDVFYVFCMFYWQIRQFSLGSIQFQEELHLSERKKNTFPI